jgi:signal peptidase II
LAILTFLIIAAAGVAFDLLSKHYVFASFLDNPLLPQRVSDLRRMNPGIPSAEILAHQQRQVIPGVMRFTLSTNPGVVFSLPMKRWAVIAATTATVILVLIFFLTSPSSAHLVHAAMAFILAGALGNLYDRLFTQVAIPGSETIRYQVRDFIDCSQIHYAYIFNVADILLVAGVALLMLQWLRDGKKTKALKSPAEVS